MVHLSYWLIGGTWLREKERRYPGDFYEILREAILTDKAVFDKCEITAYGRCDLNTALHH